MNKPLAFASLLASATAFAAPRPKLAVVVVIDQFRRSELERLKPYLHGGFRRLLDKGAVLDGRYRHQNTYTGPGHAQILSGSYGYVNGITQNRWFNRESNRAESMLFDPDAHPLDGPAPQPADDVSPRNFIGSTVGDEMKLASGGRSKVIAVALKERGAMLLGGRLGTAYFFSEAVGRTTTSSYYMKELPAWVRAFNDRKLPDKVFGKKWERSLPTSAYEVLGADDSTWESSQLGLGRTFPHPVDGGEKAIGPAFYEAFTVSPFGVDYTFELAKAAIEGEQLGAHPNADLLAISVSSTDLIGHTFGVYSHEVMDTVVRTDRALGDFLSYLDKKIGADNYVVALTADHGATMPPEQLPLLAGRRIKRNEVIDAVEKALTARYGQGPWVVGAEDPSVYLDDKKIDAKKLAHAEVEEVAAEAVRALPGFATAFTRTQLLRGELPQTRTAEAATLSFYPQRNGDVICIQAPYSYWATKDTGGSHGSVYRYDADVPLVLAGPPFKAGYHGATWQVDLAATLSHVLGVANPAGCEGEPIERILK